MTRRPPYLSLLALLALGLANVSSAWAEEAASPGPFETIHVIEFEGEIEALLAAYMKRRVNAAVEAGADCIVLRVDSFGGTVIHSKEIGDLMLGLPRRIHTVAWIPTKAISGAAMVSLACREIVMSPMASMGDSQPVVPGEDGGVKPVGEKAESPLRTWFRTYAETNGYPIALAEAMVSEKIGVLQLRPKNAPEQAFYVRSSDFAAAGDSTELVAGFRKDELEQVGPAVVREGELLTFTADEARKHGFVKRRVGGGHPADEAALLKQLLAPGGTVTHTRMSFSERASKFLLSLTGILIGLVVLAVGMFIFQGPGLMTVIGGIALVLVLMISATAEHLHGFPIFLLLLGVGLLAAEVFLLPGFTIPGFLGIASMVFGLLLLATGHTPDNIGDMDGSLFVSFGLQFVATILVAAAVFLALGRFLPRVGPGKRMILVAAGESAAATGGDERSSLPLGATGITSSPLRPAGTAEFDGALHDVVSDGAFVDAGVSVRVVAIEGPQVTVAPHEAGA